LADGVNRQTASTSPTFNEMRLPATFSTGRSHCYNKVNTKEVMPNFMRNLWKKFYFTLKLVPPIANDKFWPTNDWYYRW